MCCESCLKYTDCEAKDRLKDDCCKKCPDYYDCIGMYQNDDNLYKDIYSNSYDRFSKDYFEN